MPRTRANAGTGLFKLALYQRWGQELRQNSPNWWRIRRRKTKLIKEDRYTSTRLYRKTAWHVSRERARHRFPAMAASHLFLMMLFGAEFSETASVCIRSGSPALKPYARLFCRSARLKKQWKYSYSVYHSIYEYVIITISNKDSFCRKRAQNVLRSRRSILYAANQLMRLIRPRARTRACGLKSFLNLMLWGFDRVILCRISETRKYCIGVLHRCECSSCSA